MAETSLLRSSAIVRNAAVGSSPPLGPPGAVKTGELPLVQVRKTPGGPQVLTPQPKPVEILPPRDANSALRTGGLPMVNVKMTAQGAQLDDGQDKPVVILPPKDQKHSIAAGGLPMVNVNMMPGGPQVQNLPTAQPVRAQIQGPPPAVSQPNPSRGVWGAAPVVNRGRVQRVAAPKAEPVLPPVPEFTTEQLMLCRHLVGKYLTDLSAVVATASVTSTEGFAESAQSSEVSAQVAGDSVETHVDTGTGAVGAPEELVHLVEVTIEALDQALVAVAVRAEAAELAAAAAAAPPVPVPVVPATSIIPAAPSTSYVVGRVGGRPNGYARGQRDASLAPRRVAHSGDLPMVQVKMEGRNAVVQNKAEVDAARAARRAQKSEFTPEAATMPADLSGLSG